MENPLIEHHFPAMDDEEDGCLSPKGVEEEDATLLAIDDRYRRLLDGAITERYIRDDNDVMLAGCGKGAGGGERRWYFTVYAGRNLAGEKKKKKKNLVSPYCELHPPPLMHHVCVCVSCRCFLEDHFFHTDFPSGMDRNTQIFPLDRNTSI